MKAKRIAGIAHKMSQLNKEMDALNASLKDEHGSAFAAQLIAKAIIENTFKAITSAANSDQLRAELTANNIEMNRLTERNDAILSTLRVRGLEPVRVRDDVKCKVRFVVDKPLTDEQLMTKGYYCADNTVECLLVLLSRGLPVYDETRWLQDTAHFTGFTFAEKVNKITRTRVVEGRREIIRKGNEFYYV